MIQPHVVDALSEIEATYDEESSQRAYNRLLFAVGNNHAGTFRLDALHVVPRFEAILRDGQPWPRRTVLEIMIDLCGSFYPEPFHEFYNGKPLKATLIQAVLSLHPLISSITQDGSVAASSAAELIEVLERASQRHPLAE